MKAPHSRKIATRRPVMALIDLIGRRWALRVLWELRDDALTSRALRAACDDISPTVLQARIDDLRDAGLVTSGAGGYQLTTAGRELVAALAPLNAFAKRWAQRGD